MKLLFDENLSHKLAARLEDVVPGSSHVRLHGMAQAADPSVWAFASDHDFTIVSKDEDSHHLSFLRGAPPKIIGIGLGNCTTTAVEVLLRSSLDLIQDFGRDSGASFLMLK